MVTSSPRAYAERLLAYHQLDIPVLVAYHDIARRNPHPDPILQAASRLQVLPGQCICVGDSDADMLAARAAGAVALGVTWGEGIGQPEHTHGVCHTWQEVLAVIRAVVGQEQVG